MTPPQAIRADDPGLGPGGPAACGPPAGDALDAPEMMAATVELDVAGRRMTAYIEAPLGPTSPQELLPLFRSLADAFVQMAEEVAEQAGRTISCRRGCGACCRQLVPISETEARWLSDCLRAMPEPRRSEVVKRFEEARARLEEAGLLDDLLHPREMSPEERVSLGLRYFHLGIPCPFLEEESCSIHPDRPLACREYLVTSPAEHCADPSPQRIRKVPVPGRASHALARLDRAGKGPMPWVPLVLAPEWAEVHPEPPVLRPGTELIEEFFARLATQSP